MGYSEASVSLGGNAVSFGCGGKMGANVASEFAWTASSNDVEMMCLLYVETQCELCMA